MRLSLFPDVNVWLALTHDRHVHHPAAARWLASQDDEPIFFCRFTQLGLLRLLTNQQVMGVDVMGQRQAWLAYRRWFDDDRVEFHREPESPEFEGLFEQLSRKALPSTKRWADAYLGAFAKSAGLTLVTFDQAFGRMLPGAASVLALP